MNIERRSWSFASFLSILTLLFACGASWGNNPSNIVYVLGDSLSDPGNFYELTGFWPESPPYAERFTNGPVWAEYFAEEFGVESDNRAYGGAFTGIHLVSGVSFSNFNNLQYPEYFPDPLPGVYEEIESLLADHPEGLNPKGLYVLWAGPNDFFLGTSDEADLDLWTTLEDAIGHIAESVCALGTAGARHFIIGNMPDISLTPLIAAEGPETQATLSWVIAQYNLALEQTLTNLPASCAETIMIFDSYQTLNDIVDSPGDYGLTNVTEPCLTDSICAAPDEYLFWDPVHPTTRVHQIFADRIGESFCQTDGEHPGLRGYTEAMPPSYWRGVCFGSR